MPRRERREPRRADRGAARPASPATPGGQLRPRALPRPAEAEAADRALRDQGIIVRRVAGYRLPQALRITVGDAEACARVAGTLGAFMKVRA